MTLEEAIEHCKEVAKESREAALTYARENAYETAISCKEVGYEYEQFAKWLTELKTLKQIQKSMNEAAELCKKMHGISECPMFYPLTGGLQR